jgi:hypothetical protein
MDPLIAIIAFAPLVLLIVVLVRYASRIRHDVVESDLRAERLQGLNRALVRFVLERDRHTCQSCGGTTNVGVDFTGETPDDKDEVSEDELKARCADCYLTQWRTLHDPGSDKGNPA